MDANDPKNPKAAVIPKWNGHQILDHRDIIGLEIAAAENEFKKGWSQSRAEAAASRKYLGEAHLKAAGHHLSHIRANVNNGNKALADDHSKLYNLHLGALQKLYPESKDFNPHNPTPKTIESQVKPDLEPPNKYVAHKADGLLFDFDPKKTK